MNGNISVEKDSQLNSVLDSFINSYAERDQTVDFSEWLESKLQQEIPGLSREESRKIADDIINAVADYDKTLSELNIAVENGQSKEEWLADNLEQAYKNMEPDIAGERLQGIEDAYISSSMQLMQADVGSRAEISNSAGSESIEWNKYALRDKAYKIGEQVAFNGIAIAANALENKIQNNRVDIEDAVKNAFQNGIVKDTAEVKAVVAGAVRVAAEKGLEEILPSDTPVENICGWAGVAVEGAEALFDAANGDISMTEALDKTGRAAVAEGCRVAKHALESALYKVPYVGPLLVNLLGGLLDHMESPVFFNNVYTVVHDAAIATWEGIKQKGKSILRRFSNLKNKALN